ncbi:MAG: hypothetical protein GOVbin2277_12 [Prokaryotic dsDNA virus sp.]|jgi:hypothetical protein|nr:MAG: hypothetical protein GOVbin2277_12 [Prokaryotic dsDNA virus sp.]|tara:strand:+ start:708 stop:1097 length:390 start_codon:yes stop_codon:yes gene_type:complete
MTIETPTSGEIIETLEELNPEAILYDGFDDAVVGMIARCGTEPLALYDREKCIEILMAKGASHEEAEDYFCYNVEGCWAGPHTPFIGSFNLNPVGVRFPPGEFTPVENKEDAAEVFLGTYVHPPVGSEE